MHQVCGRMYVSYMYILRTIIYQPGDFGHLQSLCLLVCQSHCPPDREGQLYLCTHGLKNPCWNREFICTDTTNSTIALYRKFFFIFSQFVFVFIFCSEKPGSQKTCMHPSIHPLSASTFISLYAEVKFTISWGWCIALSVKGSTCLTSMVT